MLVPLCGGCQEQTAPVESTATQTEIAPATTYFPIRIGDQTVRMQLALFPRELQRGLMHREQLAKDDGMIFVFAAPQPMSFWMRNTRIPLDIGYFTPDGVLREIYPLQPFDEVSVRSQRQDLQLALEVNQGWYGKHGIRPGAQLDMHALKAAMLARGIDPTRYGLD
ncbi:MAG: DUF192 domain-containing protein [Verrucomicrobiota bacterium]